MWWNEKFKLSCRSNTKLWKYGILQWNVKNPHCNMGCTLQNKYGWVIWVEYEWNIREICEKSALQWVAQQIWLRNMRSARGLQPICGQTKAILWGQKWNAGLCKIFPRGLWKCWLNQSSGFRNFESKSREHKTHWCKYDSYIYVSMKKGCVCADEAWLLWKIGLHKDVIADETEKKFKI